MQSLTGALLPETLPIAITAIRPFCRADLLDSCLYLLVALPRRLPHCAHPLRPPHPPRLCPRPCYSAGDTGWWGIPAPSLRQHSPARQ
jgi:hypothetical protein